MSAGRTVFSLLLGQFIAWHCFVYCFYQRPGNDELDELQTNTSFEYWVLEWLLRLLDLDMQEPKI